MSVWAIVLIGGVLCLALKVAGYLIPVDFLERPAPARVSALLTVALLAALITVQTLGRGTDLVVDARLPAIGVAAILLARRSPFLVVVVAAAVVAAGLRALTGMV